MVAALMRMTGNGTWEYSAATAARQCSKGKEEAKRG